MNHARLSPSSAYRWTQCPGSVHLIEALAESERETFEVTHDNEYIRFGVEAHALAERLLWEKAGQSEIDDPDMREVVMPYVEYVRERAQGRSLIVEKRVSLAWMKPPEPIYGTPDAQIIAEGVEIVDLKTGQGVRVEARKNKQLTLYAAAALDAAAWTEEWTAVPVRLTIVQPRAGGITTWETTAGEIVGDAREIIAAAWDVKPGAELKPGEWCRFCPAQGHCPALSKHAQLIAQMDFEAVPVDTPPAPETIPLEIVADLLSKARVLENWFAALRLRIMRELAAGREVPGWKLVMKRARRVWNNAEEVEKWAVASGLYPSDFFTLDLKSPAQLEKVVGKKNLPEELYASVSSGLTLVPASDPRPAAAIGPAEDFAALPPAIPDAEILEGE